MTCQHWTQQELQTNRANDVHRIIITLTRTRWRESENHLGDSSLMRWPGLTQWELKIIQDVRHMEANR